MKIRSILTIKYAGITATIFLVFMATIYCVNEHLRSDSFYRSLRSEAITKAHLFLNNQVDVETMQSIYLNNRQFIDEVEVAVYTPDFRILYHDALHNDIIKETPGMIDEIVRKKEIDFRTGDYQGIGILYEFGGKNYVVTAAAYDRYGHINQVIMTRLLLLLSIGGLFIWVLSFVMILSVYGRFFKMFMYTAIAPIPLSSFAGEPSQNIGKSFLKGYAAVCLEGAIIVLACIIFSVFAASPPVVDVDAAAASMVWSYIGELIFNMLILVGSIKMADRIVHEMMGL